MKKIIALLYIALILTVSFSASVQAGIKIWPGKLYIDINKWDEKTEEIKYKIQVTNTNNYEIKVTAKIDNPAIEAIDKGFSFIPDVSWIQIKPEEKYIAPKTSEFFEIIIKIPEDEKESLNNNKWDVRVVFFTDEPGSGGFNFKIELAVKLLITTPDAEEQRVRYLPIFVLLIITGIILFFVSSYIKKKKSQVNTVFYFKKDKKD